MSQHFQNARDIDAMTMPVMVTTTRSLDEVRDECVGCKVIDHAFRPDRIWLAKHCQWCFNTGYTVTSHAYDPVSHKETLEELQNAAS